MQKTEFKLYFIVLYRNAPSQKIRRSAEKFPHVFNAQKGNADPDILRKDEFGGVQQAELDVQLVLSWLHYVDPSWKP